ncbi:uncharacterized protein M8220_006724 [Acridotheres tristis]
MRPFGGRSQPNGAGNAASSGLGIGVSGGMATAQSSGATGGAGALTGMIGVPAKSDRQLLTHLRESLVGGWTTIDPANDPCRNPSIPVEQQIIKAQLPDLSGGAKVLTQQNDTLDGVIVPGTVGIWGAPNFSPRESAPSNALCTVMLHIRVSFDASAQQLNPFLLFVVKFSSAFFPIPAALPRESHESGAAIPSGMIPPRLPWSIPSSAGAAGGERIGVTQPGVRCQLQHSRIDHPQLLSIPPGIPVSLAAFQLLPIPSGIPGIPGNPSFPGCIPNTFSSIPSFPGCIPAASYPTRNSRYSQFPWLHPSCFLSHQEFQVFPVSLAASQLLPIPPGIPGIPDNPSSPSCSPAVIPVSVAASQLLLFYQKFQFPWLHPSCFLSHQEFQVIPVLLAASQLLSIPPGIPDMTPGCISAPSLPFHQEFQEPGGARGWGAVAICRRLWSRSLRILAWISPDSQLHSQAAKLTAASVREEISKVIIRAVTTLPLKFWFIVFGFHHFHTPQL